MLIIKPCPFCGELPNVYQINSEDYCECLNPCCPISIDNGGEAFKEEIWNHRPVEEELYNRIENLKLSQEHIIRSQAVKHMLELTSFLRRKTSGRWQLQLLPAPLRAWQVRLSRLWLSVALRLLIAP